jgi:hypothetical protein
MNLFITLLENVNKSRTSANNVSLKRKREKKKKKGKILAPTGIRTRNLFVKK